MRWAAIVVALAIARPVAAQPIEALGSDDPQTVAREVTAIETSSHDPDVLFAAGRACEDKLLDPARALAIYERIVRELPEARVWSAAQRRAEHLRGWVGADHAHAREATELARLIAGADQLATDEVLRRVSALADAAWPGAPEAALWRADWQRRTGRLADAQTSYAVVVTRWPESPHAITARRGGAGTALEAHRWDLAEQLARQLPAASPSDAVLRDELLAAAARGRWRARLYRGAWLVVLLGFAALLASLADAVLRGGRRLPAARPPVEIVFLAPVVAVLIAVAITAHRAIAPAVATISIGGLGLAWLSGTTLDLLRLRGRPVRARVIVHIAVCVAGVAGLGYIALVRDGLLDMLVQTVRFGPDP